MVGEPYFDPTNTKILLSGTAIECPLITQELINHLIQYALDTHWGKKNKLREINARTNKLTISKCVTISSTYYIHP